MVKRILLLILLALVISMVPLGALADDGPDYQSAFQLGLVPYEGEAPEFDYDRLEATLLSLPSQVNLSGNLPPVSSQGSQGSCVGWALGYYYHTYLARMDYGWNVTQTQHQFSPAFIYNQRYDGSQCPGDNGMTMYRGLTIVRDRGGATLNLFPYNQHDACTKPSQAVLDAALPYRTERFERLYTTGNADVTALKQLLVQGQPWAIAVPVYTSFYQASYNNPVIGRPGSGETFYGGHAMLVVGYDDQWGGFLVVNSWGSNWVRNGYAYLSYDFVRHDTWEGWVMYSGYQPPMHVSGTISANGGALLSGASYTVRAYAEGTQVAQTNTYSHNGQLAYAIEIPADSPYTSGRTGARPGDTITITVGGVPAEPSLTWSSGQTQTVNLVALGDPLADHRVFVPMVIR